MDTISTDSPRAIPQQVIDKLKTLSPKERS